MAQVARAAARVRTAQPPATVSPTEGFPRCDLPISIQTT